VILALWLAACGGTPPAWSDCPDAACRQDGLMAAWKDSPDVVLAVFPGLDATEQAVLIDGFAVRAPAAVDQLCASLPEHSAARQRCDRLDKRPHLAMGEHIKVPETSDRKAPGPAESHLRPTQAPLPEIQADCPEDPGEDRDDCHFQAAEALAKQTGTARFAEVLAHCRQAGHFEPFCIEHVTVLALPPVPPADKVTQRDLDAIVAATADIGRVVGERVSKDYVDKAWARWAAQAYRQATTPTGGLLRLLPPQARPHVKMGLATRIATGQADLGRWMQRYQAALQEPPRLHPGPSVAVPAVIGESREFWDQDRPDEDRIHAAYCLGPTRRAVSEDPGQDDMIVLLEAAARSDTPPKADFYLSLVGGNQPELIRWTAARLAWGLDPGASIALGATDPSPLVRSWLEPP